MKKKALLLTSMVVLACTVGVTALAVGGANQLDAFPVKANPVEYSVTFDAESTTVEEPGGNGNYAICTTTARGNKLGVVGFNKWQNKLSFCGVNFGELQLSDISNALINAGANDFDHITGFAISFSGGFLGGSLKLVKFPEETVIDSVESGKEYTGLTINPSDNQRFTTMDSVTVTSLTIWYSC